MGGGQRGVMLDRSAASRCRDKRGSDHPARVERVALAKHERGHELAEGGWYDELWSATACVSHDRVAR